MDFREQINSYQVEPSELERGLDLAEEWLANQKQSQSDALHLIAAEYPGEYGRALAVYNRLRALELVIQTPEVRGWAYGEQPDGSIPIKRELIEAAAVQPLETDGNSLVFDPEEFFSKALELSTLGGQA